MKEQHQEESPNNNCYHVWLVVWHNSHYDYCMIILILSSQWTEEECYISKNMWIFHSVISFRHPQMKHRSDRNQLCWSPCYLAALARVCFAEFESSPFRYHFQFFLYWNGQWMQQYFKSPLQLDQVSGISQMDQEKRDNIDCWHCSASGGNPQSDREDQSFQLLVPRVLN